MQERQKIINEKTAISLTLLTAIVSAASFVTALHARANKQEEEIARLVATDKYLIEVVQRDIGSINTKLARIEERLNIESIIK